MTIARMTSAVDVKIIRASPDQEPILANMLELYAHDFSEFLSLKLGPDGRFGYSRLHLYWEEGTRHPLFVKADGSFAGFVLVSRGSEISHDQEVWDMAEFFILRGFRRLGLGMRVAHKIWKMFPGRWEVRVRDLNQGAKDFWARAINSFLGETIEPTAYEKGGAAWHLFSFESTRAA